jgi:muconolactone D-isomerase
MEFLVRFQIAIPPELDGPKLEEMMVEERRRGEALRSSGRLLRLWRVPGTRASVGLYNFADATELHTEFSTLPLFPYMSGVTVEPLAIHPAEADTPLPAGDGRSAAPA